MGDDDKQDQDTGEGTGRFRLVRDLGPRRDWARWKVLEGEQLVGFVAEDREWLGDTFGPASYMAVHNPTGAAFGALWKAEGLDTPRAALEALRRHLLGDEPPAGDCPDDAGCGAAGGPVGR